MRKIMEDRSYFIEMPRDLTSYEFYTHVLPIRNEIEYRESDIIVKALRDYVNKGTEILFTDNRKI